MPRVPAPRRRSRSLPLTSVAVLMAISVLAGGVATWLLTPGASEVGVVEREGTSWVALPTFGLTRASTGAVGDTLDSVVRLSVNQRSRTAVGSAVIIRTSGYAVTAASLVEDSSRAMLALATNDYRFAQVVGIDRSTGLALLRFDAPSPAPAAVLATFPDLQPATDVVVLRGTGTHPVAKLVELTNVADNGHRFEVSVPNPAQLLGAAVLGNDGTVVGIATHITGENLGVVPIDVVAKVANTLLRAQN